MTRDELEADRELLLLALRGHVSPVTGAVIVETWFLELERVTPTEVPSEDQLELVLP